MSTVPRPRLPLIRLHGVLALNGHATHEGGFGGTGSGTGKAYRHSAHDCLAASAPESHRLVPAHLNPDFKFSPRLPKTNLEACFPA